MLLCMRQVTASKVQMQVLALKHWDTFSTQDRYMHGMALT